MYLPDPAAALRRLAGHLRPGGIVACQEMAMPLARSVPEVPLFRQCRGWIIDTIGRAGFEVDMGGKLLNAFAAAGLGAPQMNAAGLAGGGPHSPIYDYVAGTLRSLLPMAEQTGVATAAEMDAIRSPSGCAAKRSGATPASCCRPLSAHGQTRRCDKGEDTAMSDVTSRDHVAHLVDPREVDVLDVLGPTVEFLTPPGADDHAPCLMRGTIAPGIVVPLHSHADPETFLMVSGEIEGLAQSGDAFEWVGIQADDDFRWRRLESRGRPNGTACGFPLA